MTNFEVLTHAELYAMATAIHPEGVSALGTQLTEAATTIEEIGNKLKDHKVDGWEGEAADAFRNWVSQAGSATLGLAEFSAAGGKCMTETALVMGEVKGTGGKEGNMPPYNASTESSLKENLELSRKYHNDPDAVQLGQDAWRRLNGDHARAVDAMNKLAQAYDHSTVQMNRAQSTAPTFPPPPPVFVPEGVFGDQDMARPGGGGAGGGAGSAGSSYGPSSSGSGPSSNEPGWVPGHQPQPDSTVPSVSVPGIPDRRVDVGLDSLGTLPDRTVPPVTTTPGGPLPTGPGPSGPTPGPFVPTVGLPSVGGLKGAGPGTGPGLGPYPRLTGPNSPAGRVGGMPPGMPPRDAGIMGGRPVTSTGPGSGIPRGTVIGEGAQAGRGMGGPMGGGMGGGAHGGGGTAAGRRLASEPGGIVGGRQSAAGRPIAGGKPFTQGGSGLVRNGAVGAGAHTPGKRRDEQGGERPDYLVEDEETWQGNRRVAPPVID
ncbi:WXG100 family type VII secretion target [Streptomyces sp. NPDC059447]|uniref:WXG100 family type VII secretion target n=1 Tax=Streptomyces sp. NPDC059447 TaxID=3346834 RepID=UPI0036AA8F93